MSEAVGFDEFLASFRAHLSTHSARPLSAPGLGRMLRMLNAVETQDLVVFFLEFVLKLWKKGLAVVVVT